MVVYDGVEVLIWPQVLAALSATGGALALGLNLGWSALIENQLKTETYDFKISDEEFSWISSLFTLGAACVCIPIGYLITAIGRKTSMLLLVLPFMIGYLLLIFATTPIMLYIGRFVLGIAGGAFCVTAPMYTGEISSKEIRGTLGSFFQLMITIGILLAYIFGATIKAMPFTIISSVVPIVFGIIFCFMPESPTYFISKEKTDKAIKSLKWLRGKQYDPTNELALLNVDHEHNKKSTSIRAAFSRKVTLKSFFISLGLMFCQQLCGINAVIFYSGSIYEDANTDAAKGTIMVGVVQVIATFISTMVVDKVGRRILLLLSGFVMMLCTITLGAYFFLQDSDKNSVTDINWLPILCLCVFIAMFSIGYGPVPWLMMGELFSTDIKGIAGSISGTINWILAFVVTKSFKNVTDTIGSGQTFWLFSCFTFIGLIFVFFCVPETKNKTLLEIQKDLGGEGADAKA